MIRDYNIWDFAFMWLRRFYRKVDGKNELFVVILFLSLKDKLKA